MRDWLKFAVCYWHTFRGVGTDPFGPGTIKRPWEDGTNSVDNALRRQDVAFEFMTKLGNQYWCFHDRDIALKAPPSPRATRTLTPAVASCQGPAEGHRHQAPLQRGTANLFSNPPLHERRFHQPRRASC